MAVLIFRLLLLTIASFAFFGLLVGITAARRMEPNRFVWVPFCLILLAACAWILYKGLPFAAFLTERQRWLISFAGAVPLAAIACPLTWLYLFLFLAFRDYDLEKRTETFQLPSGEILENQTRLVGNRTIERFNHLSIKSPRGAREFIADVNYEASPSLLDGFSKPFEIIHDDEKILVIGPHMFQRSTFQGRSEWFPFPSSAGEVAAGSYLQSFNNTNSPFTFYQGLTPEFKFDSIDLEHCVLTLRRTEGHFNLRLPDYLVFSALGYQFPWEFDILRTKATNGSPWARPMPGKFVLDISEVMFPKPDPKFLPFFEKREISLIRRGAREVFSKTIELSDTRWTDFDGHYELPNGTPGVENLGALYGCDDPAPGGYHIFWRLPHSSEPMGQQTLLTVGHWLALDAGGFNGDVCLVKFVRLRGQP